MYLTIKYCLLSLVLVCSYTTATTLFNPSLDTQWTNYKLTYGKQYNNNETARYKTCLLILFQSLCLICICAYVDELSGSKT